MADSKSRKSSSRKKRSLFIFNNLTDELLNEIFIRLPSSKEAIRCKLVCKRWFSLISSDYFVTTSTVHHRDKDKASLPFTFVLLLDRKYNGVEYVECPKGKRSHVDLGFLLGRPDEIRLEASCGDLILCSAGSNYSICNILTRQWIILPPSPSGGIGGCIGVLIEPNNEYKVLRYFPFGNSRIKVDIFSSEQGRWTQLLVTSPRTLTSSKDTKISLIACGRMLYSSPPANFVLAFDPFTNDPAQILHIIDLPLEARKLEPYHIYPSSRLGVCRGRLRFSQVTLLEFPYIRVWELEDYRMGKWRLVHRGFPKLTLKPSQRSHPINEFYVLAFHPNNEDLICCRLGNYRVVMYNLRTDKVETCICPRIFRLPKSPEALAPSCSALQVLPITQKWWPTPVISGIVRFQDKESHQIFLEPEGRSVPELCVQDYGEE